MRRSALAAAAAAATLVGVTGRARAVVLSADELEDRSLAAGVIARAFSFVLGGDVLRPPYVPEDASPSSLSLFELRPYLSWRDRRWKLELQGELSSLVRSHGAAGALPIAGSATPPRLLPLRAVFADGPTLSLTATADRAYVAYSAGALTLTIGRQAVTFGRAKVWRPTDLVAPFSLTAVDTEYKPGVDALRVDWSAGARTQLTLVATTGDLAQEGDLQASTRGTAALARLQLGWGGGEVGVLAGYVRGDAVAGLDGVWDAGALDLHGEAVATLVTGDSLASPVAAAGDVVLRAAAGATFAPAPELTVSTELLYDGFGAADAAGYLGVATSDRAAVGEQVLLGRVYAGAVVSWAAHPLLHVDAVGLLNAGDPSALLSVSLSYSVSDDVRAIVGGYLGLGALPAPPVPRSELGLVPAFAFVELKAAL